MTFPPVTNAVLEQIKPISKDWAEQAKARQDQLTKPPGSLGRLESLSIQLAAIQQTLAPQVRGAHRYIRR